MAYNQNFTVQIIVRTTLLLASMVAFAWLVQQPTMRFNQLTIGLLVILQAGGLIWYVQKTNRALERFFLGIRHGDLTMNFQQTSGGHSFRSLEASMQQVLEAYQQVKIEKEAQYHFMHMLVEQLPIGILTLAGDELVLMNTTAAALLHVDDTRDWKRLQAQHPRLVQALDNLGDHGRTLLTPGEDIGTGHLAVAVSTTVILGKPHRLISLQDIRTEIEQQEIEAWHKLIRILTHEIMNSVTPIASLTETLQAMLTDPHGHPKPFAAVTADNLDDIRFSLNTIHKRSEGLLSFVDKYRTLSRVPRPTLATIHLRTFLDHISTLLTPDLQRQGITLTTTDDTALTIAGDAALIEQVIINLVSNSTYALQATPQKQITIRTYTSDRHTILEVTDNGKGISPKEINDIFIPFFSTRKEGMGIGLSLSKQIMSLHGGTIRVQSTPGQGTSFKLYFKKS